MEDDVDDDAPSGLVLWLAFVAFVVIVSVGWAVVAELTGS